MSYGNDSFGNSNIDGDSKPPEVAVSHVVVVVDSPEEYYGGVSVLPMWKTYLLLSGLFAMTAANAAAVQAMNTSVGFISIALSVPSPEIAWIVTAYSLSSGCLLMLYIPLCKQIGNKFIFIWCCVVYIGGCIGCAAAQGHIAFLACRTLMGVGACAGIPSGFALISEIAPIVPGSSFRSKSLTFYSFGAPIGAAIGTILGGLTTQYASTSWRGTFGVLAGMAFYSLVTLLVANPKNIKAHVKGGADYIGAGIISASLCLILFAVSQGPSSGWTTSYICSTLVIGCVLMPCFVLYEIWLERRGLVPMMPMSMFLKGRFLIMNLVGFFGFGSYVVWDYFIGQYYLNVKNCDAIQVMLRYVPGAISGVGSSLLCAYLLRKIPTNFVFVIGALCATTGTLVFCVSRPEDNFWERGQFFGFVLAFAAGPFCYGPAMTYLVTVVDPEDIPVAGGTFQVMTSLAPAMLDCIATVVYDANIDPNDVSVGYRYAFWTAFAFGVFALLFSIPALWGMGKLIDVDNTGESMAVDIIANEHTREMAEEKRARARGDFSGEKAV